MTRPPGCGKGTESPIIKDEYCLCHLATGDMLRAAVAAKTPLGIKAKEAMDKPTTPPTAVVLLEASAQPPTDNIKQQIRTSQPF
ncbi:Adenylate kinase A [Morella rubra]|uniref:adenylate kinase n=1 Tax=Morella rubra TaxID=262757 RepID=A0A6A1UML0_9ROSI|nr:Adenylate kinase A [Morella rubra]